MQSVSSSVTRHDVALLLVRVALAGPFIYHGAQKLFGVFGGSGIDGFAGYLAQLGFPLPLLNAYIAGSFEFFGGLALLLGVLVRPAAVALVMTMAVAVFTTVSNGYDATKGGAEFPLTLLIVLSAVALVGGGQLTLPALLRGHSPEPEPAIAL